MQAFRIRERLAAGFVAVALVTTAGAGVASLSFVSRTLADHVRAQISDASAVVSRSDFALNPSILRLAAEIGESRIVTFSRTGVLASTLHEQGGSGLAAALAMPAMADEVDAANGGPVFRDLEHDGVPYYAAYRRVEADDRRYIAVASDTSRHAAARRGALRMLLAVAVASTAVLGVLGFFVARRVSRPIEEKLVRSEKLAVAGLLAARVAHDVRNPLSSIKMQTQLLRSRLPGDAENQALLDAVLSDIGQVENVVTGLLEVARPGELRRRPTQLNDIVTAVLAQVAPQMTHRKIRIDTALDDALPPLPLDPDRFRQALLNVITNAADAMTTGGTLRVTTTFVPERSAAVLDVCDDGSGIDPRVAGRLFNPFVSSKRDGVGLGLVNTRSVVDNHGGSIELSGRPEGGTRARITLPISHG